MIRLCSKGPLGVVGLSVQYLTRYVDLGRREGWEVMESGKRLCKPLYQSFGRTDQSNCRVMRQCVRLELWNPYRWLNLTLNTRRCVGMSCCRKARTSRTVSTVVLIRGSGLGDWAKGL